MGPARGVLLGVCVSLVASGCIGGMGALQLAGGFKGGGGGSEKKKEPPPAPAPPPPQMITWTRLTLSTGQVIDCQIVGGDATNFFVQTPQGTFSVARAQVVSSLAMSAAAPAPPPPPQPVAPPQPTPEQRQSAADDKDRNARIVGVIGFLALYGVTVAVASSASKDDPTASSGYIPVAGPIIWAARKPDDDKFGYDGGDWAGMLVSLVQFGAVMAIFVGDPDKDDEKDKSALRLRPMAGKGFQGIGLGGSF